MAVVNIDHYLAAKDDPAASYFSPGGLLDVAAADAEWVAVPAADIESVRLWLAADPENQLRIIDALVELAGLQGVLAGREEEALRTALERLGTHVWEVLGPQLPSAVAHHRVWQERRASLDEFRAHLDASDWSEEEWQTFFTDRPWILGFGLDYQFLHLVWGKPYTGGKDFRGVGGVNSDYLLASGGTLRFTMLVEIKKPNSQLLAHSRYRNRVFAPGDDLVGGVSQLRRQAWEWARDAESQTTSDLLESREIYTHEPRSILIVGDTRQLLSPDGRVERDKLHAFESFRRALKQPEVLTFDELYERAASALNTHPVGPLLPDE